MTAGWTLFERCSGSAALSLHLLGARRKVVGYQGSKWSLRRELETVVRGLGFEGPPSRVILQDAGPIGAAIASVLCDRAAVLRELEGLVVAGERDPVELFAELSTTPVPRDRARRAAVLLWLQVMNYSGKAVGAVPIEGTPDHRWVVHGLNRTHAFGVAATERFGAVYPQGRPLLEAVAAAPVCTNVAGIWGDADLDLRVEHRVLAFVDPPYQGTTPYPSGHLDRAGVVAEARRLEAGGAAVVISEAGPIFELGGGQWHALRLRGATRKGSRQSFRRATRGEEWVTVLEGSGPRSAGSPALFDMFGRAAEAGASRVVEREGEPGRSAHRRQR